MIEDFYTTTFTRYTLAPGVSFPYDLAETSAGTFKGALSQVSAREAWLDAKMTLHASHRIFCPSTVTVLVTDKITTGTRTFIVRTVNAIDEHSGHHKEIMVDEVV